MSTKIYCVLLCLKIESPTLIKSQFNFRDVDERTKKSYIPNMQAQHALLGHLLVYLFVYLSMSPEKYKSEFKPCTGHFTTMDRIGKGKNQTRSSSTSAGPWFFLSALETLLSFI